MRDALRRSDASCDALFFYAVKTAGIFCRPSCRSKLPRQENALFFASGAQARAAGFRPCRRCRSDLLAYHPMQQTASEIRARLDAAAPLEDVCLTPRRMTDIFKLEYVLTSKQYECALGLCAAKKRLAETREAVTSAAYPVGFSNPAAFCRFLSRPGRHRQPIERSTRCHERKYDLSFAGGRPSA